MDRKILILHNSAIIREGLSSIIHKFTVGDDIAMEVVADIKDHRVELKGRLLVFTDAPGAAMILRHNPLSTKMHRKVVGLVDDLTKKEHHTLFDEVISMDCPVQNMRKIVARFFDLAGADTARNEGMELTMREREVLKLVGTGFSNKEIADALFISTHTVISHRKNITEKLGIKSISGLTIYAMLHKIIDSDKIDLQSLI